MKTFGLVVPRGRAASSKPCPRLLAGQAGLARIILPVLEAWRSVRTAPPNWAGSLSPARGRARHASC